MAGITSKATSTTWQTRRRHEPLDIAPKAPGDSLYSLPSQPSRDGRNRMERQLEEVGVETQAVVAALLRVELRRHQVAARQDAGEAHAVVRLADDHVSVVRIGVVAVDEVKVG